jgi:hypothetical protein
MIIFDYLIKIFSPLLGLLGFYKKRHVFYNFFFKDNTIYSPEIVYINELYKK